MRLLVLALVGATLAAPAAAAFRPKEMAEFREKNEEKIKQAILDMESGTKNETGDGERSDLAGMKRDPDDTIQKMAREQQQAHLETALEKELEKSVKRGLLGSGTTTGPFDYLMFTMIYPTATCMADDDQAPGSCEIPAGTAQWTIHGLWPNYADGSYPQFCDHQKFDKDQVQQLHDQMRTKWPNLFPKTAEDSLWSHEWEKHGTCSKSDALLDTQFKYFNMSLFMLDHIDLRTRMEQKGISPRAAPYERDVLQKTLDEIMGHHVQMYCLMDKKTHESLLADIRVCVDRELKPIDCPQMDIRPFVLSGTLTPNDHQPLPVPRKCADSLYYVTEGADISKSIDVLPPGKDGLDETGKKLATDEEDDDDYYDDEEEKKKMSKEESEKERKLEEELMKGLRMKTDEYLENRRIHSKDLVLTKDDITIARNYAEVTEKARKFQEWRVRESEPARFRRSSIYLGIGCTSLYIVIIIAFFVGRRNETQQYGRLQHA
ncbi:hypothetical protein PFISCL1PPCAC_933 [Pristionchus fissidentatus]|uniref:Uncharacterized protein n=1 Tax=Pristionchus fissidentatus TaxID=1538716 RepID=A0AAV5UT47_9BILA|nr:hypothetical protein PFISCL1PPCAC_933 [Pristionchus fissidentatus]